MITQKGKRMFFEAYKLVDLPFEQWAETQELLSKASRLAATHQRYAVIECNGCVRDKLQFESWGTYREKMTAELERIERAGETISDRLELISNALPSARLEIQGDPRGATVWLVVTCDDGLERSYYFA